MEKMKLSGSTLKGLVRVLLFTVFCTVTVNAEKVKFLLLGDTQHIMNTKYTTYKNLYTAFENIGTDPVTKDAIAILSMGDMIETGRDNDIPLSYKRLKAGFQMLDIPYVIAYGNNDKDVEYDKTFPESMFKDWPSYVGISGNTRSIAHEFSAGGVDWLVISIRINPSSSNLKWAEDLIKNNPKKKVIVVNHDMSGEVKKIVLKYENVVLAACGHTASQKELWKRSNGSKVGYIKHNWHSKDYDHYLCVVTMDTEKNTMSCRYYSPYEQKFGDDTSSKFWASSKNPLNKEEDKNNFDHPWIWEGFAFDAKGIHVASGSESNRIETELVNYRETDNTLHVSVPLSGNYTINLISLSGAVVANMHSGSLANGTHQLSLGNLSVSAGVYLVQVEGAMRSVTKVRLR